jgi:DNA-binding NtrC family response regulator
MPYKAGHFHSLVTEAKREILEKALLDHRGNRTHSAATLGVTRPYLQKLIRQLHVDVPGQPGRRRAAE